MNSIEIVRIFSFGIGSVFIWFFIAALAFKGRIKPKIRWWMLLAGLPLTATFYIIILYIEHALLLYVSISDYWKNLLNIIINPVLLPVVASLIYWLGLELILKQGRPKTGKIDNKVDA